MKPTSIKEYLRSMDYHSLYYSWTPNSLLLPINFKSGGYGHRLNIHLLDVPLSLLASTSNRNLEFYVSTSLRNVVFGPNAFRTWGFQFGLTFVVRTALLRGRERELTLLEKRNFLRGFLLIGNDTT